VRVAEFGKGPNDAARAPRITRRLKLKRGEPDPTQQTGKHPWRSRQLRSPVTSSHAEGGGEGGWGVGPPPPPHSHAHSHALAPPRGAPVGQRVARGGELGLRVGIGVGEDHEHTERALVRHLESGDSNRVLNIQEGFNRVLNIHRRGRTRPTRSPAVLHRSRSTAVAEGRRGGRLLTHSTCERSGSGCAPPSTAHA
jgi:hypothetical protein